MNKNDLDRYITHIPEEDEISYLDIALNKHDTVEDLMEFMGLGWDELYNLIVSKYANEIEEKYRRGL
jgi:hypothetical protein